MTTSVSTDTEASYLGDRTDVLIGGRWVRATGPRIPVIDPSTEETIATVTEASEEDVRAAVAAARDAFDNGPWPTWTPQQRAAVMEKIADRIEARIPELARIGTLEGGVPGPFSEFAQSSCVGFLRRFIAIAREYEFEREVMRPDGGESRVVSEPVGVVAAIVPWNGALPLTGLKLGPALIAGCTAVLKTPQETPLTTFVFAEVIAELTESGDLPPGVVSVLTAGAEVSQALVADPNVDKISFTGSTVVGKQIMAVAAERIARVTLELGGKSAAIILDDAPIDDVLQTLVLGGCGYTGQMCFGLTRVLVSREREAELLEKFAAALEALPVGSAHDASTMIGPLTVDRQLPRVQGYVDLAVSEGARIVTGGGRPATPERGYFFQPTLLADVRPDMRIAQEEVFGPVISVITYEDVDDAVRIANNSDYGLAGSVYTSDIEAGYQIARRIRTGTCSVNGAVLEICVPFGGFKQSGLGREGGVEGFAEYLEKKSIHMPA
ncbi:aldehyde dehydrogenase [Nocardia sp. NPDC004860]|uniref:aldehyde dehydrogenase n=1 Tax=Nocardia sp. NPDC004860 TaxID=3154557 RepID=UPI0033B18D0E